VDNDCDAADFSFTDVLEDQRTHHLQHGFDAVKGRYAQQGRAMARDGIERDAKYFFVIESF